MASKTG